MENENQIQLYCNVDDNGEIMQSFIGLNIIPGESYDFFFLISGEQAENINDYKIVMSGFKAELIRK
ncbi:hypothetical protein ACQKDB_16135 [Planococcus kocurii]|uniref:hypothetical protein n=1 Tax=Planococcus kocurii TaxID=1374 RepID=UPI003D0035E9